MVYTGKEKQKFLSLARVTNKFCPNGHPILSSHLVGAYSCDNIDCNYCCSFTVLHLYLDQIDKNKTI